MRQEWPHRLQQPIERSADLVGVVTGRGQVTIDVLDGRLDDVERIAQRLEFVSVMTSSDSLRPSSRARRRAS